MSGSLALHAKFRSRFELATERKLLRTNQQFQEMRVLIFLCVFLVAACADPGEPSCPHRAVLASNFSTQIPLDEDETVEMRIENGRKSRQSIDLFNIESDFSEVFAVKLPAFKFAAFKSRVGAAWRVRDSGNRAVLWQKHILEPQANIVITDCVLSARNSLLTEPPMRIQWKSNIAEAGGAGVRIEANAAHLCGGHDWSDCPISAPMIFDVTPDIGHLSWPHTEVVNYLRTMQCPHCNGTGVSHSEHVHSCSSCNASGILRHTSDMSFKQPGAKHTSEHSMQVESSCSVCGGFGNVLPKNKARVCPVCGGRRSVKEFQEARVEVPLSAVHGTQSRIHNRGDQLLLHSQGHIDVKFHVAGSVSVELTTKADFQKLVPLENVDLFAILEQSMGAGGSFGTVKCLVNGTLMIGVSCTENIPAIGRFLGDEDMQRQGSGLIQPQLLQEEHPQFVEQAAVFGVHAVENNAIEKLRSQIVSKDFEVEVFDDDSMKSTLSTQNINSTALHLLELSGLLNLATFETIQRSEEDPSVLSTMAKVSIMEAVNGFHAAVPLPDGRIAHAVSATPKSPFEVMQVNGVALPNTLHHQSAFFHEEQFCSEQPYIGNVTSQVLSMNRSSTFGRSVAKGISALLRCIDEPNDINCASDPRKRDGGLLRGLAPLQVFSYSTFSEFWRNPALYVLYASAGCARPRSETLGSDSRFTAQDAIAEMSSTKRCINSCQETYGSDKGESGLRWKSGWCETVCPQALALYEATACVENMPQRAAKNLGHLSQIDNMTHAVSFPKGFIPFCALPQESVDARAHMLREQLAAHLRSVLKGAAARYMRLFHLAQHLRKKLEGQPGEKQNKLEKLTLTSDARFLHWIEKDMNATRVAAAAMQGAGAQRTAREALTIRSTANLFSEVERVYLYAPLHLQIAVMYPSSLDEDAQSAIREAFGDPAKDSSGRKGSKKREKSKRRRRKQA